MAEPAPSLLSPELAKGARVALRVLLVLIALPFGAHAAAERVVPDRVAVPTGVSTKTVALDIRAH